MTEDEKVSIITSYIGRFPIEPDTVLLLIMKIFQMKEHGYVVYYDDTNYDIGQNALLKTVCVELDKIENSDHCLSDSTYDVIIQRLRSYYNSTQRHFSVLDDALYHKAFSKIIPEKMK